jgi:hypothetical protein
MAGGPFLQPPSVVLIGLECGLARRWWRRRRWRRRWSRSLAVPVTCAIKSPLRGYTRRGSCFVRFTIFQWPARVGGGWVAEDRRHRIRRVQAPRIHRAPSGKSTREGIAETDRSRSRPRSRQIRRGPSHAPSSFYPDFFYSARAPLMYSTRQWNARAAVIVRVALLSRARGCRFSRAACVRFGMGGRGAEGSRARARARATRRGGFPSLPG